MARKKSSDNNDSTSKRKNKNTHAGQRKNTLKAVSTPMSSSNGFDLNGKVYFFTSLVAVMASIVWKNMPNHKYDNTIGTRNQQYFKPESLIDSLLHLTCQNGNCWVDDLQVQDGSLHSGRRIEKKSKLFEIPIDMQIGSLDALRDNFVRTNLIGARHSQTNAFLVEDAFLAAHIAMLKKRNAATQDPLENDRNHAISSTYLESLPTYDYYRSYHPVTFDLTELESLYGTHTHLYFLISNKKEEIDSEYKAFTRASSEFGNFISYQEYIAARLNVQTRAFEGGPLSDQDVPLKELDWYINNFGVDIKKNVIVMVPILDSFTSHDKKHNVRCHYDPESKKFVAYANKNMRKGAELVTTRGDRADLFATYGFVYGDFSERTSMLLGGHQVIDERVVSKTTHITDQKNEIIVYLQQDDGYKECVDDDDVVAMGFKSLKRKVLLSIVNQYENWIVSFPALDRDMGNNARMSISVDTGVNQIISTSRLLALSHRDYDGDAYNILKAAMEEMKSRDDESADKPFTLKSGGDGLEYRTYVWMWRLASYGLNRYCGAYQDWTCSAAERNEMHAFEENSKRWHSAYVRYQEIVALETLREFAQQSYIEYTKNTNYDSEAEEFFFRSTLCPIDSPGLKRLIYD